LEKSYFWKIFSVRNDIVYSLKTWKEGSALTPWPKDKRMPWDYKTEYSKTNNSLAEVLVMDDIILEDFSLMKNTSAEVRNERKYSFKLRA
jgi:hypothetical protein